MKRILLAASVLLALMGLQIAAPTADARPARVVHRGPHGHATVVVHRGFPIRRHLPAVIVRPPRAAVALAPRVYLAPVVWRPAVVALPFRSDLVWEDGETLAKDDDWTDFTLNVNDAGRKLFMRIEGTAQLNFAEVVFANGDAQVVDFNESTRGAGVYSLLDFADGRKVAYVRMVARARTPKARIVGYMAK
jgi:hypothetical protein